MFCLCCPVAARCARFERSDQPLIDVAYGKLPIMNACVAAYAFLHSNSLDFVGFSVYSVNMCDLV